MIRLFQNRFVINSFYLVICIILSVCFFSCITINPIVQNPNLPLIHDKNTIIKKADSFALVGKDKYEFTSIVDALSGIGSRKTIVIMDAVHTESGIIIDKDIAIIGYGQAETVIRGAESASQSPNRIIEIMEGSTVFLYNLTISNGRPAEMLRRGGGILSFGDLEIVNCTIRDNEALYGAGIFTNSKLLIRDSTISGNRTFRAPSAETITGRGCTGSGGGIKTEKGADVEIYGSLITDNSTFRKGGGIFAACETNVYLENCTISGNSSAREGGGIHSRADLQLVHCTIVYNQAERKGGGIFNYGYLDIVATLISNNLQNDFREGDDGGGIYGNGIIGLNKYNLVSDGSLPGSLSGDPGIKKLKDNGGATFTHALKYGSSVIGVVPPEILLSLLLKIDKSRLPVSDQRGSLRDGYFDIGAFER
jgi:hypothetical protein